jgi:uncharacterized protein YkwD
MELLLFILINATRTTPVIKNTELVKFAEQRAEYLCNHEFSHGDWKSYKSSFSYRGENLAKGFDNAVDTHIAFLASPTHKAVIINKNYQYVGIANKCGITVKEFGGNNH